MHSPQETHVLAPIGASRSNAIFVPYPLARTAGGVVVLDLVAAPDTAALEEAGLVVHGDDLGRTALRPTIAARQRGARRAPPAGQGEELVVAGGRLFGALSG